jgi:NAD(P)-dependent dehydrogenase (short-subunit alcohol dehydrogenase family)
VHPKLQMNRTWIDPLNPNRSAGGASGIGRALALEYARRGTKHIALSDVNEAMLKEAQAEVEAAGAAVTIAKLDVCDKEAMQRWIYEVDAAHPLDIVHANAGLAESSPVIDAFVDLEKVCHCKAEMHSDVMGALKTAATLTLCRACAGTLRLLRGRRILQITPELGRC